MIDFSLTTPAIFTYRAPDGKTRNYWYFTYTLTNKIKEGKKPVPATLAHLKMMIVSNRGKYYFWKLYPEVETQIISYLEKLNHLPQGERIKIIKRYKEKRRYLNMAEIKKINDNEVLNPGEELHGIAIFDDVEPRTTEFSVLVSGLFDPVKARIRTPAQKGEERASEEAKEIKERRLKGKKFYELESVIYKLTYDFKGDPYQRYEDLPVLKSKKYLRQNWGPLGDKKTVENMIKSLEDENPLIRSSAFHLLQVILPTSEMRKFNKKIFLYNPKVEGKDIEKQKKQNKESIALIKEWWFRNMDNLVYNHKAMQFVLKKSEKDKK